MQTSKLPIKFLQFGEGNFLRAFADYMINQANSDGILNAGVCVFNLRKTGSVKKIKDNNCSYNLISRGIENGKASVKITKIDSIVDAVNPYEEFEKFTSLALLDELRFVISNSTEAGIYFDSSDTMDLCPPLSFPAKLTLLLNKRYEHFKGDSSKGLIMLPCELLERNGDTLKECVLKYATLWNLSEGFKSWLDSACVFCNTLVDRIVSGRPSENEKDENVIALNDPIAVVAEPYLLWAIEAPDFVEKELPFAKAGINVVFTKDISPYRSRKVTLLNAPHTLMSAIGLQMDIDTVLNAVSNSDILKFLQQAMFDELAKTLTLPEEELSGFANEVLDRFRNPYLEHFLSSIAGNAVAKCTVRVIPPLERYIQKFGKIPSAIAFGLSANIVMSFYNKTALPDSEKVAKLKASDNIEEFAKLFTENDFIMASLSNNEELKNLLVSNVLSIKNLGMQKALKEFLDGKLA